MMTKKIKLYTFDELSDEAKEKAMNDYIYNGEFCEGEDYVKTIQGFCNHFGITLDDYSLGEYGRNFIEFGNTEGLTKSALKITRKWIEKCPLTGMCYDMDILEPLLKPKGLTVDELLNDCKEAIMTAYMNDLEYCNSEEGLSETFEANEYTFREDGTMENL